MKKKIDYSMIPKMTEIEFNEFIGVLLDINITVDYSKLREALKIRYNNSIHAYKLFSSLVERRERNAAYSTTRKKKHSNVANKELKKKRIKHRKFKGKIRRIISKLLLKMKNKKKQLADEEFLR